jgi:putative ABC transport system permease protein
LFWELIIGNLFFSQPKFAQNQFDMLKNYFNIALRVLFRNKFYSIINIVGLTIGLSACIIIYLIASFELGYEHFQPDMNRIYRAVMDIRDNNGENHLPLISYSEASYIKNHFAGIDQVAYFFDYYFKASVTSKDGNIKVFPTPDPTKVVSDIIITEPAYFDIFKYEWLVGNPSAALSDPFKVVLSENKARDYFGSVPLGEVIGREIVYNDSLRLTVSGIVRDYPKNTDFVFKEFISLSTIEHSFLNKPPYFSGITDPSKWGWSDFGQAFVKLSPGINATQIANQTPALLNIENNLHGKFANAHRTIHLQPLSEIHFNPDYGSDYYTQQSDLHTLYGLMGIAALILLIAAINFINLSTAQSIRRAKEIGIRKVLGTNRTALILQCLSETFVLVLLAIMISMVIARLILNAFPTMVPDGVRIDVLSPPLLLFLFLIAVITTLLSGFYPARVLSSYSPAQSFKGTNSQISNQKSSLRKIMIVFQFTVSIIFIIGTIMIGNQVHYLLTKNLGFQKDAIINFFNGGKHRNTDDYVLADQIRQLSGVEKVSVSAEPPETNFPRGGTVFCKDKGNQIQSQYMDADDEFVPLYGLKILTGRDFNAPRGKDSSTEFLLNETCSRQLGFKKPEDAIGHLIQEGYFVKTQFFAFRSGQVVGVLADFHSQPLNIPIGGVCIAATKNLTGGMISAKLSTLGNQPGDFNATVKNIERQWKKIYPDENFNYSFYNRTIAAFYSKEQTTAEIMNIAMAVAILISCIGLFGLITYMAAQRTKEIGIRKVLGASVTGIALMLAKEFVLLIIFSMVIASPIAYYLIHQWLQGFAYRVNISWWLFVMAGMAAILIALLTISYQALKAALANPVKSLRSD